MSGYAPIPPYRICVGFASETVRKGDPVYYDSARGKWRTARKHAEHQGVATEAVGPEQMLTIRLNS